VHVKSKSTLSSNRIKLNKDARRQYKKYNNEFVDINHRVNVKNHEFFHRQSNTLTLKVLILRCILVEIIQTRYSGNQLFFSKQTLFVKGFSVLWF